MDVERVVMMSGCPGGPGDANANWVTTAWPPEASRFLSSQWDQVVILYGLIDVTPNEHRMDRAWSYRTLGRGDALSWWKQFRETTARRVWRRALNRA